MLYTCSINLNQHIAKTFNVMASSPDEALSFSLPLFLGCKEFVDSVLYLKSMPVCRCDEIRYRDWQLEMNREYHRLATTDPRFEEEWMRCSLDGLHGNRLWIAATRIFEEQVERDVPMPDMNNEHYGLEGCRYDPVGLRSFLESQIRVLIAE